MHRLGIVIAAGALAVALVWLGLDQLGGGPPGAGPAPPSKSVDRVAVLPGGALTAPGTPRSERRAAGPVESRIEDPLEAAVDDRSLLVRVVRADGGAPVAGARVLVQRPGADPLAWREAWARRGELGAVLAAGFGDEHQADGRGELRLPRPERRLRVFAEGDGLRGQAWAEPGELLCVVELSASHAIEALVVGPGGVGVAGVRVALLAREAADWSVVRGADSDEQGRVVLRYSAGELEYLDDGPLLVAPTFVRATPDAARIDRAAPPSGPLRFVVGDVGRVVVRALDEHGAVRPVGGEAALSVDADRLADPTEALAAIEWDERPLRAGAAAFERVGVGVPLRVVLDAEGFRWQVIDHPGPRVHGEVVEIDFTLRQRRVVLRGRVVDARGAPLPRGRLSGWVTPDAGARLQVVGEWTDEDGRFVSQGSRGAGAIRPGLPLALEHAADGERGSDGVVLLPDPDGEGVYELGDVRLEPLPLVARGTVELADGTPVSNAEVLLSGSARRPARTSQEGRFAISGERPPGELELVARHQDHLGTARTPVPADGREMKLVMWRGAALVGRLVVPAGIDPERLHLEVAVEPDPALPPGLIGGRGGYSLGPSGAFELGALLPGAGRLDVLLDGAVLARRPGLALREGEATDVGEVELTSALHAVALTLVDEAGAPLAEGVVERLVDGATAGTSWPVRADGSVVLGAPEPLIDVRVSVPQFPPRRFEGVSDGDRLVVRAGVELVVRATLAAHLIDQGVIVVRALPVEGPALDTREVPLVGSGELRFLLPEEGPWRLEWRLLGGGGAVQLESSGPEVLDVRRGGPPVTVEVARPE